MPVRQTFGNAASAAVFARGWPAAAARAKMAGFCFAARPLVEMSTMVATVRAGSIPRQRMTASAFWRVNSRSPM